MYNTEEVGKNLVLYYLFSGRSSNVFHNTIGVWIESLQDVKKCLGSCSKHFVHTDIYYTFEEIRYLYNQEEYWKLSKGVSKSRKLSPRQNLLAVTGKKIVK